MPVGVSGEAGDRLVLFVCTGNICRSPFAERYAASRQLAGWAFASAGVAAVVGAPMDDQMSDQLRAYGGDPGGFVARPVSAGLLGGAELILTMSTRQRAVVIDERPDAAPRCFTLGQWVETARELDAGVHGPELLTAVRSRRVAVTDQMDVPDPYRQGRAAAVRCAALLVSRVDELTARLA